VWFLRRKRAVAGLLRREGQELRAGELLGRRGQGQVIKRESARWAGARLVGGPLWGLHKGGSSETLPHSSPALTEEDGRKWGGGGCGGEWGG